MAAETTVMVAGERWAERRASRSPGGFSSLVAASAAMKKAVHQMECATEGDYPVLLIGENGTGKRLMAEIIHRSSERRHMPFISIPVTTLPAGAMELQLFGTVCRHDGDPGGQQPGAVRAADGGSLFIDEIRGLTRTAQAKLLDVLEKGRVTSIADDADQKVDIRLIAASSRDLEELVDQGRFRADLYYRLNVVSIYVPPLRQRREDIPALVRHFLEELSAETGLPCVEPEPELMRLLEGYDWPGNVRQLRDCLRSMVGMARTDRLTAGDLCSSVRRDGGASEHGRMRPEKRLAELERMAMVEALEQHGGNRTCAAEALGISVRTLQRKLKKWNAERSAAQL